MCLQEHKGGFLMLDKNDIHNILIFMKRTTLNGEEVPAYNHIVNELSEMLKTKTPDEVKEE